MLRGVLVVVVVADAHSCEMKCLFFVLLEVFQTMNCRRCASACLRVDSTRKRNLKYSYHSNVWVGI